ncbi:MAG TPA: energy transducer TonB [Pyrinomonadaceae bacterium]|jgi:TonB family protein
MFRHISILFLLCLFGFCVAVKAQTETYKPLKILSKPAANYTNAARANNIQGRVRVKVTFMANGKIGKVSDEPQNHEDVKKSGLVKAAIEAAKKIRFEPAIKNGKPVTAVKIIEYTFTLY